MYALSNKIYVGSYKLIEVQLPGWTDVITGTFRSSGRLFWMAGYLILFGVLSAVLRKRSHLTILLLLFALVIQWVDTQPRRDHIIFSASQPGKVHFVSWEKLMNRINTINFYPAFGCGAADPQDYLYLQLIAANSGKHFNTGYLARQEPDCIVKNQIFEEPFQSQQLYVSLTSYLKKNYFGIPAGFREAIQNRQCLTFGSYVICQNGLNLDDWSSVGFQVERYSMTFGEEVYWSAGELPTRIGKVASGRLVATEKGKSGFLSYGPYANLPPGMYSYCIEYLSNSPVQKIVGKWDIMGEGGTDSPHEISSGLLTGTDSQLKRISGKLNIKNADNPLEIRSIFFGDGDLQLIGISLKKES